MIVDSALYRKGQRVEVDCFPHEFDKLRDQATDAGDFVWVGLYKPSEGELDDVAKAFSLHPLAVEDALKAHQRPKLERYQDGLFLVLKTLWYVDEEDAVETGEINLFVGRNYVVSVRHGKGTELHKARLDLEQQTAVLGHGPSAVVYAICDHVVDRYMEAGHGFDEDVREVELQVFGEGQNPTERIYKLEREVLEFQAAAVPLGEALEELCRAEGTVIPQALHEYFRDVEDHLRRVATRIENFRQLLDSALEANLTQVSMRQNEDMRKISAWVAIAAVPTMVAGIYGMNFEHMPELEWRLGYPAVLVLILAVCSFLYWRFKRAGWL